MILVACGLRREARLIARDGVAVAIGGGDAARLEAALEAAVAAGPCAILSIGLAGALDRSLRPGDVVISSAGLRRLAPGARVGTIVGSDTIVATVALKRALRSATGAIAVDMESHVAARVAARHGLPFAILRTISDGADRDLPPAALIGMKADGSMALGAVLAALARDPAQLPALVRTGIHAGRAFRSLRRALRAPGAFGIGGLDPGELGLDMR